MHIQDWISEITKYTGESIKKLVMGNKSDMEKERKVSPEEIGVICCS